VNEIVRKIDDGNRGQALRVKVKRPLLTSVVATAVVVLALVALAITILGYLGLRYEGETIDADLFEGFIVLGVACAASIGAGVAILLGKNKTGGAVAIVSGVYIAFGYWFLGIPIAIAGVVAYRTKEDLEAAIVKIMDRSSEVPLSEIARELKRTEADIEIALQRPSVQQRNIAFVPESRGVRKV